MIFAIDRFLDINQAPMLACVNFDQAPTLRRNIYVMSRECSHIGLQHSTVNTSNDFILAFRLLSRSNT